MNILLCDDSKAVHNMFGMFISEIGHSVDVVDNGYDLILKLETKGPYDAIFLDWEMPKLNGLETLKIVRSSGHTTPVVMLTGKNSQSHISQADQAGSSSYLMKPFTKDLIEGVLKSLSS